MNAIKMIAGVFMMFALSVLFLILLSSWCELAAGMHRATTYEETYPSARKCDEYAPRRNSHTAADTVVFRPTIDRHWIDSVLRADSLGREMKK